MSWSIGFDDTWGRDIGYGVPAKCDHPKCNAEIDRGLGYVCGGDLYGGERGCGLFFCIDHGGGMLCARCRHYKPAFSPKPDVPEWLEFKLADKSWSDWRDFHEELVAHMRESLSTKPEQPQ